LNIFSQTFVYDSYATNVVLDGSNAFVFNRLWSNQSKSKALQFSYSTGKLVLLDSVEAPHGFNIFLFDWPIVAYSASFELHQVAVALNNPTPANNRGIWVLNYDDNPSKHLAK